MQGCGPAGAFARVDDGEFIGLTIRLMRKEDLKCMEFLYNYKDSYFTSGFIYRKGFRALGSTEKNVGKIIFL